MWRAVPILVALTCTLTSARYTQLSHTSEKGNVHVVNPEESFDERRDKYSVNGEAYENPTGNGRDLDTDKDDLSVIEKTYGEHGLKDLLALRQDVGSAIAQSRDDKEYPCVSSCNDKEDGDFQSCKGCDVYVTCSNGKKDDSRRCPVNLVWDDTSKRCERYSTTCNSGPDGDESDVAAPPETDVRPAPPETDVRPPPPETDVKPAPPETDVRPPPPETDVRPPPPETDVRPPPPETDVRPPPPDTDVRPPPPETDVRPPPPETDENPSSTQCRVTSCVTSCSSGDMGFHHTCGRCDEYSLCLLGFRIPIPCPGGRYWDDSVKQCVSVSTTCRCRD